MENKIKDLKESPLYNLSLVNKELFHSNFIAWFGKTYPKLFIVLIEGLLDGKKWLDGDKFDIRREFLNIFAIWCRICRCNNKTMGI